MTGEAQSEIYNIPAGMPFLRTLAQHLLGKTKGQPEELTRHRILLPTRRTCRIMRETFLRLNDGQALLLPQMMPIGEVDEEELSLLMYGSAEAFLDIPDAIKPMHRQLLLAKLIMRAPDFAQGYDHALMLSKALCELMDEVQVEGLSMRDLDKIVPEDFAQHWGITLTFLNIVSEVWPSVLEAQGVIEQGERRNLLLQALSNFWKNTSPSYPVIAAGSTGSIPAVAELLGTIAKMPNGCVVLPGVDMDMDSGTWDCITESHPQYALKRFLNLAQAGISDVKYINEAAKHQSSRAPLASAVMLPAEKSYAWKTFFKDEGAKRYLDDLSYYDCKTQQEEAAVIALMMRENVQDPFADNVTALVTPDRSLARRVSAYCRRWGIEVDDSAGAKLQDSRLGKFILLSFHAAITYDPYVFLSLLKLSLCRFGYADDTYKNILSTLEIDYLRQGRIISSLNDLIAYVKQEEGEETVVYDFLCAYESAVKPLRGFVNRNATHNFSDMLKAHVQVAENLACTADAPGRDLLWRGEEGESAALFLTELMGHADLLADVTIDDYEQIFASLLGAVTVRQSYGVHPRLLILGQLEARLSHADLVIMGGLNEGTWPSDTGHDPWMSRPMRKSFGLPAKEQAIGIAAHDFVQNFCGTKVVMTRAQKVDGSPTVPSRWVMRLDTILNSAHMNLSDLSTGSYIAWAGMIDKTGEAQPCDPPEPRPPVSVRPNAASVTKIENWLQDPYGIYMRYVLKIRKLQPLLQDSDAALKGALLHEVLHQFVLKYPAALPDDAHNILMETAKDIVERDIESPELLRYWWPKFGKIAEYFISHEAVWRERAKFVEGEIRGNIDINIDGILFNLYGVADRIDKVRTDDGDGYAVIDYKSGGGGFTANKLRDGALPQLPLEAIMLRGGAFYGKGFKNEKADIEKKYVPKGDTKYLGYWTLNAKGDMDSAKIEGDLDQVIDTVMDGFQELVRTFRKYETPFYAVPNSDNAPRFNDYEHVARIREWTVLDDADGGES